MVSVHDPAATSRAAGLASTAMQQAATPQVRPQACTGKAVAALRFVDKGNLRTVGRATRRGNKGIQTSGMLAWLIWLSVHILLPDRPADRLLVLTRWAFSFVTRGRGARLITGDPRRHRLHRALEHGCPSVRTTAQATLKEGPLRLP